ncbi:MAG: hypothetical protein ACSLE6_19365 [Mycobacterium sp.]
MGHHTGVNLIPLPTRTISDGAVAAALFRTVQVIDPLLYVLWETDPLSLKKRTRELGGKVDDLPDALAWVLNAADVPGTEAWDEMDLDSRIDWWVHRVGAVNTLAVAFPGFLGVIADRLPIQDLFGFTNQAIVLCAVAHEHGVTDQRELVRLLAVVLCHRDLSFDDKDTVVQRDSAPAESGVAVTLWNALGLIRAVGDELAKRPRPRGFFRYLGMLPAVGAVADYVGEYGALDRAAKQGQRWIAERPVTPPGFHNRSF